MPFPVSRPARDPGGTYIEVAASRVCDPFALGPERSFWWRRGLDYSFLFAIWNRFCHGGRWVVVVLPERPSSFAWERDQREPLLRREVSGLAAAEAGVDRLVELVEAEGLVGLLQRDARRAQEA